MEVQTGMGNNFCLFQAEDGSVDHDGREKQIEKLVLVA